MVSASPPTSATNTREPYSIEQIMSAVMPVLAALSGGPVDPADARGIASLLSGDVNSPTTGIAPGQNLLLNADFIRRVAERKGPANGQDQDAARKQIADALKNANVSSSAFAAALGQSGFASAGFFARGAQQSDDAKSGGRFKDINSGNSTGDGSGYSWLTAANQNIAGFSQAQVAGAANFLKGLGLTREEVNDNIGDMVHLTKYEKDIRELAKRKKDIERRRAKGEDVSEDEKKYDEDKDKVRGRMTPDQQKRFDHLPMLRADHNHQVRLEGTQKHIWETTQNNRVARAHKLGIEKEIQASHDKDVAEVKAKPELAKQKDAFADELAGMADERPAAVNPVKAAEKAPASTDPKTKTSDAKQPAAPTVPNQQIAKRAGAPAPSVG